MGLRRDVRTWVVPSFLALIAAGVLGSPAIAGPLGGTQPAASKTCPLTGISAPAARTDRPAVAVRVSNSEDARSHHVGIATADLVIETLTEGGITRFIAVFHCSSATTAGPVRSARMDDATITSPFSGLLAFSGANSWVTSALDATEMVLVAATTADAEIYRDPPDALGVNTVRADVEGLRSLAIDAGLAAPTPSFAFGPHKGWSAPVTTIGLDFGGTRVQYRWGDGVWERFQSGTEFLDATGRQVTPRNVLVQEVDTYSSPTLFDVLGTASPTFDLVDAGRAYLFRDGRVIPGRWTDAGPGAPVFRTHGGAVMKLAPGRTWLEMVPSSNGDLKGMVVY